MKKVLIAFLVLVMMASVSFAAKAPVAKAITASSSGMKIGLGSYLIGPGFYLTGGGFALINFLGDTYNAGVGLGFESRNANNATNSSFAVLGRYAFNLTGGNVPTHVGGGIIFRSIPDGSAFAISLLYGAETIIANSIQIGFDVLPLIFTSQTQNNATTTVFSLGSATIYTSYLF